MIYFSNAKCAGNLTDMRVTELAAARRRIDVYIVRVAKNKVKSKACYVALSEEQYTCLVRYVKGPWRPAGANEGYVFVTSQTTASLPSFGTLKRPVGLVCYRDQ